MSLISPSMLTMLCVWLVVAAAHAQQPANPAAEFQALFESFAERAGPMAPMFGKLSPEQVAKIEAIDISLADENRFGNQVLEGYLEQLRGRRIATTTRGQDVAYVVQLCDALKPHMAGAKRYRRLDIRLVETDASDAYSIPGGHLLLTRGLLNTCGTEAALVGVLAHELSHLDHGHQLLMLKQSKLSNQPLDFRDGMLWISLIARPFRPEQESQADADACQWMMALGYEPKQLVQLLESWQQQQAQTQPWMQFIPNFVKSHPDPGKRAQAILQNAGKLHARFPDADYVGVENLRQRIPKSQQEMR